MTGVLVDTSVWVGYFRPHGRAELRAGLRDALLEGRVRTCQPVCMELLVGARSQRDFGKLRALFSSLTEIPVDESLWEEAAKLGFTIRRKGLTVPLPHLLIAQAAMRSACELWHADGHYETIRRHVPLATRSFL